MKILIFVQALLIASVMLISCKKDNPIPPGEQPQLNLTLEDVSCTEAWIKLTTANLPLPANVELQKDGIYYQTINLISADSTLYIDSLFPNKTYSIKSINQSGNQSIKDSVSVATMDTTSQDFTWQTFTFGGQAGSCVLNDVAIIDENNIWAVGEIYLLDSLGQPDPYLYNLTVWNGNEWELKRVPYYYQGQPFYHPIQSVFVFNEKDIWFCGNGVIHWDGAQYIPIPINNWGPNQMNKIWGSSSNDLYIVGSNGSIAHYQNDHWSSIESGTDLNINDIWGHTYDSGEQFILCAASNFGSNDQKKLLKINNNNADTINWTPQRTLFTIWFQNANKIYAGGSGVYTNAGYIWDEEKSLPHNFTFRIRGNDYNDVYATGGLGYFAHFNGYSWNILSSIALQGGDYESLDTKGNTTCVVGYIGAKAVVTIIHK